MEVNNKIQSTCGDLPPRVNPRVSSLDTIRISSEGHGSFCPDHTSTLQATPDSLSARQLPASLQVLLAT